MAKSVNKVILVGNLGKDPEVKFTPSGVPVAKFSLATNERYKDKGGEWQDRTEWHNTVDWKRLNLSTRSGAHTTDLHSFPTRRSSDLVAKFSLATNERYKDKGGEWQDRTEWHNIVAWQRLNLAT